MSVGWPFLAMGYRKLLSTRVLAKGVVIAVLCALATSALVASIHSYTTRPVFLFFTALTIAVSLLGGSVAGIISLSVSIGAFRYFAGTFGAGVQQRLFANICVDLIIIGLIAYLRYEHEQVRAASAKHVAELEAERARWKRVVEGIADEVWVCSLDGRMSLVNLPSVTHMNLEEFKNQTVQQVLEKVEILNPNGTLRPPQEAPLLRVLRGEPHVAGEEIMRHGSNERWRQFSAAPICDSDGNIAGAVAVVRDITERKRLEQALITSEKLAATGRLAATIAHEINNPLAAMTNIAYLLENSAADPAVRGFVTMLQEQIRNISRITARTLNFSRDTSGVTEFRLDKVLGDVLDFYANEAKRRQVTINRRIGCDANVFGCKGEISQVVSNLLINALHATAAGGQVTIHLYSAPAWLAKVRKQDGYCIAVADSGVGIDIQDRNHIFEPFFTTKGEKGTGLGLWVCMGIIQRSGGSIRVRTTTRRGRSGTCFSIFLPATTAGRERTDGLPINSASLSTLDTRKPKSA